MHAVASLKDKPFQIATVILIIVKFSDNTVHIMFGKIKPMQPMPYHVSHQNRILNIPLHDLFDDNVDHFPTSSQILKGHP